MLALAPAQAARKLTSPAKCLALNATPDRLWGECQGGGVRPYLVGIGLRTAEYACKCACPGRKSPCKHGPALLLHVAGQGNWGSVAASDLLGKCLAVRHRIRDALAELE